MNTKEQGAIGVARAIGYYTSNGHKVFIPVSDVGRYDLVVDKDGDLKRVEVKTTTSESGTFYLATKGGNQSWSGVSKKLSRDDCDLVFLANLHTGNQREFSSDDLHGRSKVTFR